jgi:hypothetical protein
MEIVCTHFSTLLPTNKIMSSKAHIIVPKTSKQQQNDQIVCKKIHLSNMKHDQMELCFNLLNRI